MCSGIKSAVAGAVLAVGEFGNSVKHGLVALGKEVAAQAVFALATDGASVGASAGRAAVGALMRDAVENPSAWRTVGAFTEAATAQAAKGGVSIQRVIENKAGDQLVEHTVLDKAGRAVDGPHFRPMYKARDIEEP